MNSDIDNWVDFLNETISKSNIPGVSFNNKGVIRDLKLSAVPMLKQFIGNVTGRNLTNLLGNDNTVFIEIIKNKSPVEQIIENEEDVMKAKEIMKMKNKNSINI